MFYAVLPFMTQKQKILLLQNDPGSKEGAATFIPMAFSLMTFIIVIFSLTVLSMMTLGLTKLQIIKIKT